ncbi:hypothetical protein Q8F55_006463 [Vanrija albida]|uniref:Tetratricopeptide repeat protein 1 n=1 Tax=Vanrija albida TaxID=181172 RepID=A0ABR3PX87_9TREE
MADLSKAEQDTLSFDPKAFDPPKWATTGFHRYQGSAKSPVDTAPAAGDDDHDDADDAEGDAEGLPDLGIETTATGVVKFTTAELEKLLSTATGLKESGNKHFTAKPQRLEAARGAYLSALDSLSDCQRAEEPAARFEELDDAAAAALQADEERRAVEQRVRDCTKAVWGNLGAVYLALEQYKESADACTKALQFDAHYVKVLQRRATANEKLGSWSSLTTAQDDYTLLLTLLPKSSAQRPAIQRTLASLPARITTQQEKEKDEMLGKLKELGNGILGRFGLSTDMFNMEQQSGGGFSLNFRN